MSPIPLVVGAVQAWLWFATWQWWSTFGGPYSADAWACTEACELGVVIVPLSALVGFLASTATMGAVFGWLSCRGPVVGRLGWIWLLSPLAWLALAVGIVDPLAEAARRESSLDPVLALAVGGSLLWAVRWWHHPRSAELWRGQLVVLAVATAAAVVASLVGLPGRPIWVATMIAGAALVAGRLVAGMIRPPVPA